ncbi:glycosyltransferase family 4 protein [Methanoculleus sp.]|uniref:glycosyltransferase family 4 protein n=1 Tax=Methanoculleus sp. TaxID=90427 RepID=UPI00261501A5|nr:glycosyltransferase family 4 protein [Methanoculleus sp.]MCK9297352.1 glycosyltransferase family 4 protein [Methanoculleus sp.]MDD2255391.1 glycosyltransferase family 4 protein [Methanoculleus sp.]MDD2788685.1 glycosyltransferase family 4 protein [Methanoculleus sp.]MDD3216364.1 glycosyltransferase family 4 protein [Methanoculleus sp.]MDD4314348.1 glycosyltransferase family 4 protein [Methanoculleus sp.]
MRIVQVTPYYPPHTGGIERYVHNLGRALADRGHEVTVLTANIPEGNPVENDNGVVVKRYACLACPFSDPFVPSFFRPSENLVGADILHVHNAYSAAALSAAIAWKESGIPTVLTHHGQHMFGDPIRDLFVTLYRKTVERWLVNRMDRIVTLSPSDAEYVSTFGVSREKISIIPNAIRSGDFLPYMARDTTGFEKAYGLEGKKRVLFVGQISTRKGVDTLVRAVDLIVNEQGRDNLIFLFIGDGDYRDKARELARSYHIDTYVRFPGTVAFQDLVSAYLSSDAYVLPSLSEGMPTVILEAMFFGLPIITTNLPCIRDNFGDHAVLVPPRDEHTLAYVIPELLDDAARCQQLSTRGRELVRSNYTWDSVVLAYERLYEQMLG